MAMKPSSNLYMEDIFITVFFLIHINVTIRECNFVHHGDNLGKGFCTSAYAFIHCIVCTCACANPFPNRSPWRNYTFFF